MIPLPDAADRTWDVVETVASLARTFTADDMEAFVYHLAEENVLELSVLIQALAMSRIMGVLQDEIH